MIRINFVMIKLIFTKREHNKSIKFFIILGQMNLISWFHVLKSLKLDSQMQ